MLALVYQESSMNKISAVRKMTIVLGVFINLMFFTSSVLADDECDDPIANWQSREMLKEKLEQQGWVVKRIRIDDGCYEVRALDQDGRRVKATYTPASLTLLELEVKHDKQQHRQDHKPEHHSHQSVETEEKLK